ncbi:MAG: DNA repair protein RecN [Myxococcales bacterium]|nr:DNA repair protein RecN [Myxococcales bacterium]
MLRELIVRRLAVIEDVQVAFGPGLNVLSGETGAGKSILVTAIGLALGWRASGDLIRTGCDDAEVTAFFDEITAEAAAVLRELEIPADGAIRVRRWIQAAGRNRVTINDANVPLAGLRRLGETLLNLYGQHEAQGLMRPETHLWYLDDYAGLTADRRRFAENVGRWKELDSRLDDLRRREAEREARLDYLRFVIDEIDAAQAKPGEDEELAARIRVLANAENLLRLAREISDALYDRETGSVAETTGRLRRDAETRVELDARLRPIADGLGEMVALAEDVAAQSRDYAEGLEFEPDRLAAWEERLQALRDLKKKYGGSLDAVAEHRAAAAAERAALTRLAGDIQSLEKELAALTATLRTAAAALTAAREKAAKKMENETERELADLDMPGTRFVLAIEPLSAGGLPLGELRVDETGGDLVEFLISPNVGELPRPLARIASGGELSRIMLAIKRVLSRHFPVPTLIFDEIDAGVGGAQAERLGRKLREVAGAHQVLCITHLPQIAALADRHYRVTKAVHKGRTHTEIAALEKADRLAELSRMLGGETITDATRAAAADLLANASSARRQARQ